MATRIGVDVGGTFTDLIFYDDESGEVRVGKEPTTPARRRRAWSRRSRARVPQERVGATEYFLHGTTVGLNALLERTRRRRRPALRRAASATCSRSAAATARRCTTSSGRRRQPLVPRRPAPPGDGAHPRRRRGAHALRPDGRPRARSRSSRRRGSTASRSPSSTPTRTRRTSSPPSGAARVRLRGRDLALAPGLGRVPRVRAHDDDGDRRVRAGRAWRATCGALDDGLARRRLRRQPARHALGRRRR